METTAKLVRTRGFAATSMGDIVTESGAPKGSLYFHFPEGKDQLVAEALQHAGTATCSLMQAALANTKGPRHGLETIMTLLAADLEGSEFTAGCPIGNVAAEAPDAEKTRAVVGDVFVAWEDVVKASLEKAGLKRKRAGELATFVLAVVEGALVLAKAKRSLLPLENAKRELAKVLASEGLS
ncbi:MAG TPA: TetR/AcrR family transcriptional regulator [Polyangiaceae bacterium]